MNLKVNLIIMNFLEFAVWGSYLTCMGGYLATHGLAGDMAARELSMTAMTSADIAGHLPQAWLQMTETL